MFVFGTLCDADVRTIVLAGAAVSARPATLPGWCAVTLEGETYPALAPGAGRQLRGLLLELDPEGLSRVAFYEGDEYAFERITVREAHGHEVAALVCAERVPGSGTRSPWSLEHWQQHHKPAFLPRVRRYMGLYGRMSVAEADGVWQQGQEDGAD